MVDRPLIAAALACLLASCAADRDRAGLPPPVGAPRVLGGVRAAELDHRALLRAFGGEAKAPAAKAYLGEIVARLAAQGGEGDGIAYAVTILDSPSVNAFSLPSGRLYVTRGLLALAGDGAEVAAVLAHEMAHVARRHAEKRGEEEARASLLRRVRADVLRRQEGGAGTGASLARFSRDQEREADADAVAMLARSGLDPFATARILATLGRDAAATPPVRGAAAFTATHPTTPARLQAALAVARALPHGPAATDRERFLAALDGLAYGADPSDGIVKGRRFVHPRLGIRFEAPAGFTLENTPQAVLGATDDDGARLLFDAVDAQEGDLTDLLRTSWADPLEEGSLRTVRIGEHDAVLATSRGTDWFFRLAALRVGGTTYRLIMARRLGDPDGEAEFEAVLRSVALVGREEAGTLRPLRIALRAAQPGDSVASLGARMAVPNGAERFRILNGIGGGEVQPGRLYKLVVE